MLSLRFDEQHHLELVQADPVIEVSDQVLEYADSQYFDVGDGVFSVHASNGEVSYGLRDHDEVREVWIGIRSDVPHDDLPLDDAMTPA